MNFTATKDGKVTLYKENGDAIRDIAWHAINSDVHSNGKLIAVTFDTGKVEILNEFGNTINTVVYRDAQNAKFQGDNVLVYYKSGKVDLIDNRGNLQKTITYGN